MADLQRLKKLETTHMHNIYLYSIIYVYRNLLLEVPVLGWFGDVFSVYMIALSRIFIYRLPWQPLTYGIRDNSGSLHKKN